MVLPRCLEEVFPRDRVLFLQALERDHGILRTALDDDFASFSLVFYQRRTDVENLGPAFDQVGHSHMLPDQLCADPGGAELSAIERRVGYKLVAAMGLESG